MTLLSFKSNGIVLFKLDSQVNPLKLQNTGLLSPIILKGQLWFVLRPNNLKLSRTRQAHDNIFSSLQPIRLNNVYYFPLISNILHNKWCLF